MHRFMVVSLVFAGAAMFAPLAVNADDHHEKHERRYYDRDGRDYHTWNDHEDRAYRSYLVERHRNYIVYGKQHRGEQRHYWKWRHEHPDHD